jgi:hypothetical protein
VDTSHHHCPKSRTVPLPLNLRKAAYTGGRRFSGYVSGLAGRRGRMPVMIVAMLVAGEIGMIGDIDRSQSGFTTASQRAMF